MESRMRSARQHWQRAHHGWPARYPLLQFPNPPLWMAIFGWLAAAATDGSAHAYARGAFYAGLAGWAWLELLDGVNAYRRVLGLAGVVYVSVEIAQALGA